MHSVNHSNHGIPASEVNTLIISCMDGRLNGIIDEYGIENSVAIRLRNAGANVSEPEMEKSIRSALEEYDIKRIMLLPHLNCGAMGLVDSTLTGLKSIDPRVYSDLVQQYKGTFVDRKDLEERVNPDMQFDRLKELIGKREIFISLSTLDPAGLSVPADYADHEHTLFVTKPYASRCEFMFEDATEATGKEVKIWGTYVVQPPDESSIRIAVENLGIKRVIFFAENQSDLHEMEHIRKGLEKKGILNGTNASIVLPNHIKKKVTGF